MLDEIAEALHQKMCSYNHTDQCDWLYDYNTRANWAWKTYREKAQKLIFSLPDVPQETIARVLKAIP